MEASGGAGRNAGVGEGDGDPAFLSDAQEARPGFAFDEDDLGGLEAIQVRADHPWKIQWGVGHSEIGDGGGGGGLVAGGGAGGENEMGFGVGLLPFAQEF